MPDFCKYSTLHKMRVPRLILKLVTSSGHAHLTRKLPLSLVHGSGRTSPVITRGNNLSDENPACVEMTD